ncbi:autoinducer 2 import system permease protein LsrC [Peptococcaceae bacterium CEB3]|nr:autoinducer 2 import system permease protein LsrC [Peptococcaceae bacterium CEB3]
MKNEPSLFWKIMQSRESFLLGLILLLLLIMLVVSPSFLGPGNLMNILTNCATVAIVALGETIVIITKGIDLSVGATMGMVTLFTGSLALNGFPLAVVILVAFLAGIVAGALNGVLISYLKLPPIIVTLGTLSVYSGIMYVITKGNWVTNLPAGLLQLGNFRLFGFVPAPVVVLVVLLLVSTLFLQFSIPGRHIYAVGNNEASARLSGINIKRVIFSAYLIAGFFSAVAGIFYVAYNGFSTPSTGGNMELDAIAAAVIGGTNVFGGKGTPLGTLLGAILLGIVTGALVFFHIPAVWNLAVEGIVILAAVISDAALYRMQTRRI